MRSPTQRDLDVSDVSGFVRSALGSVDMLILAEGPSRAIPVGGERHTYLTGLLEDELYRL